MGMTSNSTRHEQDCVYNKTFSNRIVAASDIINQFKSRLGNYWHINRYGHNQRLQPNNIIILWNIYCPLIIILKTQCAF